MGAEKCGSCYKIFLMPQTLKYINTTYRKIERRFGEVLVEDQIGFGRNRGTREAILALPFLKKSNYENPC